jgi:hypothetical protein
MANTGTGLPPVPFPESRSSRWLLQQSDAIPRRVADGSSALAGDCPASYEQPPAVLGHPLPDQHIAFLGRVDGVPIQVLMPPPATEALVGVRIRRMQCAQLP